LSVSHQNHLLIMKHRPFLLTAAALTLTVCTGLGCRDYCRGSGYQISITHLGDTPVQLEIQPAKGQALRPDSLRPGETYRFDEGPEGEMRIEFAFAGGRQETSTLYPNGCAIYSYTVDSAEGFGSEVFLPE
jgi:hypothetical protein